MTNLRLRYGRVSETLTATRLFRSRFSTISGECRGAEVQPGALCPRTAGRRGPARGTGIPQGERVDRGRIYADLDLIIAHDHALQLLPSF